MIKNEVIEEIRTRTDIVELINGYVPLKKVGRNFRGLCPFHPDKSPSFYVSPERQSYHCFGCGAGGTAISFVMAHEKLEFPDAVRALAKRLGIEVVSEQGPSRNQALYDACESAAAFYEDQLRKSQAAREYVRRRGLTADTVKRFRLGFAPSGNLLRGEAKRRNWSEDAMVQAGLLARRDDGLADYFFSRLVFPIFSLSGKVIAFTARVLDDKEPKYLNSPETPLFRKGAMLFGLFQARAYLRESVPILVEGNFDLLSLVDAGLNQVVAPLGTALTQDQAGLLRRYNGKVVLLFDGDSAGRKACYRSIEPMLRADVEPLVALLPDGTDPDSFVRAQGREALDRLVAKAQDFVGFVAGGRERGGVSEQRQAVKELTELIRLMPDEAARQLYANRVAALFDIDRSVVLGGTSPRRAVAAGTTGSKPGLEEKLVAAAARDAELADAARDLGLAECVVDSEMRQVADIVAAADTEAGFGTARVIDAIQDDGLRRRVARWTFDDDALPSVGEYRGQVRRFRADWLQRRIDAAQSAGDERLAEDLVAERSRLLQDVVRERRGRT
jgi:DNA primase